MAEIQEHVARFRGHDLTFEVDQNLLVVSRVRLLANGVLVDEQFSLGGRLLLHHVLIDDERRSPITVEIRLSSVSGKITHARLRTDETTLAFDSGPPWLRPGPDSEVVVGVRD